MTIDKILTNIKLAETVFRKLIVTTNYSKISESEISWKNYKPGIFKTLYAKEYEVLIRDKQYSFLLKENAGLIQFYYSFSGTNLHKIKLSYYPYPVRLKETIDDIENFIADHNDEVIAEYYYDLYNLFSNQFKVSIPDHKLLELIQEAKEAGDTNDDETLILGRFENKYKFTNTSHIRIDYDSEVKSHGKCEIQMGGINNIRLPFDRIIMPFTFCDFIFKNIFPDEYKSISRKTTYSADFTNSKNQSRTINPFIEPNIFLKHF